MRVELALVASLFILSVSVPFVLGGTVTRSFSGSTLAPGSDLTVYLAVDVQVNETFFAVDDNFSTTWTVVSDYLLNNSEPGHMKNVTLDNAADVTLNYVITAPSQGGTYDFDGVYEFEGMSTEATILGDTQVTVGFCTDGDLQPCQVGGEPQNETGECAYGQEQCVGSVWSGVCDSPAPTYSSAELCDGLDNDCDGSSDEDFPELGGACTAGEGICEASGSYVCTGDGSGTTCDATPGSPGTESCPGNGVDDDCDGINNEYQGDTNVAGSSPCDCIIDVTDLTLIGSHFGETPSDPAWEGGADLVADSEIDIFDLVMVGAAYGNDYSQSPWNEVCS